MSVRCSGPFANGGAQVQTSQRVDEKTTKTRHRFTPQQLDQLATDDGARRKYRGSAARRPLNLQLRPWKLCWTSEATSGPDTVKATPSPFPSIRHKLSFISFTWRNLWFNLCIIIINKALQIFQENLKRSPEKWQSMYRRHHQAPILANVLNSAIIVVPHVTQILLTACVPTNQFTSFDVP